MSSKLIIPSNFSYEDPLPFECVEDENVACSLGLYAFQAAYLSIGTILNILIIRVVILSKKDIYKNNSFYVLYTADALVAICKCIMGILFSRVINSITPLCSILSPYFFSPSIITKTYFTLLHYSTSFRTVSQIFMSFNRMTCVLMPIRHNKIWKTISYPVLLLLYIVSLDTTWMILMSRVYVNPYGSGFSVNYRETVGWPKLSLIHLIECIFAFVLVIFCFLATIIGLTTLEQRLKNAEKSLTFTTFFMATQTLLFALIQMYFAFLVPSAPNLRPFALQALPFVSDSVYVFSPVSLILMNRKLKSDVFNMKSLQRGSRSVSMTQQQTIFRINSRVNIL